MVSVSGTGRRYRISEISDTVYVSLKEGCIIETSSTIVESFARTQLLKYAMELFRLFSICPVIYIYIYIYVYVSQKRAC